MLQSHRYPTVARPPPSDPRYHSTPWLYRLLQHLLELCKPLMQVSQPSPWFSIWRNLLLLDESITVIGIVITGWIFSLLLLGYAMTEIKFWVANILSPSKLFGSKWSFTWCLLYYYHINQSTQRLDYVICFSAICN